MLNFNQNIDKAVNLFNEVFRNKHNQLEFLAQAHVNPNHAWTSLDSHQQGLINQAVAVLISNARVEASRKRQQAHFGALLGMLVSNDTNIIGNIANNPDLLMKLTQLVVIFLIRDDVDEAHNHDHIRRTLKNALDKLFKS